MNTTDCKRPPMNEYLTIPVSFKGYFPFRIGTTSYIYPDHIIPNIEMLAPFTDEIELVLFESNTATNLPTDTEIEAMSRIRHDQNISYNIHLPIDIFLGDPHIDVREEGTRIVKKIIKDTYPLLPSTYTLHFSLLNRNGTMEKDIKSWCDRLRKSMEVILETGIPPSQISIETLSYPFEWVERIVEDFGLSICIDVGHLILNKVDVQAYFTRYLSRTTVLHLHGVNDGHDHASLSVLAKERLINIVENLKVFRETVSLEIFSYSDLVESLFSLKECWDKISSKVNVTF
nr:sugar phosphate isomerase/epimerase [Desulfobacterales bacterium]